VKYEVMMRGFICHTEREAHRSVVAANWRSQPTSRRGRPSIATRLWGRISSGLGAREAFGVRRPEPALWIPRADSNARGASHTEEGRSGASSARSPNVGASCGCPHGISRSGGRAAGLGGRTVCLNRPAEGWSWNNERNGKSTGPDTKGTGRKEAQEAQNESEFLRLLRLFAAGLALAGRRQLNPENLNKP